MEQTTGPNYYKRGSIEPWDFIRDQGLNYHLGNAVKYISRAGHKDSKVEDLEKAIHYLQNELQHAHAESELNACLLYTSPSPRDSDSSRMPSSA